MEQMQRGMQLGQCCKSPGTFSVLYGSFLVARYMVLHDTWYPLPQKEIECAGNLIKTACVYCGDWLCETRFSQSKMLMGTVGDVNVLFEPRSICSFPRLGYYSEKFGCFGLLRICIYCEAMREHGGKTDIVKRVSQAKMEWIDLMVRVKKN